MLTKKEIIVPKNPPRLILIVGPCRVGTTALANIFTKIGITAHMQPIKSARRAKETGEKINPWKIEEKEIILSKETIGAKTPAEFFDPVKILLDLGYPKSKINLIPIIRDPRKTLSSWQQMWKEVGLEKFIESYELTQEIKENAKNLGIQTIPYVHEAIRNQEADIVIQKLFKKLKIQPDASGDITNWQADAKFGEEDPETSALKFYDEPPEKFIKEVKNWGAYQYREEPYLSLSESGEEFMKKNKQLKNIYEEFRKECQNALDLKIKRYNSVDY